MNHQIPYSSPKQYKYLYMGKTTITLFLFLALAALSYSSRILLILDNPLILETHTKFIKMLESFDAKKKIDIMNPDSKIQLKKYDRYLYDQIVVLGLSHKQVVSNLKINDIVKYFDHGGNILIVGDIDTAKGYRKLFRSFGVELDQYGSKVKDHFNNFNRSDVIKTTTYVGAPFLNIDKPLLYQGIGLSLVNYENYQLYELISSQATAFTRNYISEETTRIGRIALAAGIQGLNNARAVIMGSLGFFSDSAFAEADYANEQAATDLLAWTFKQKGVLRVSDMYYHGEGGNAKETVFNVGQKIFFQATVEMQRGSEWLSYNTDDLQVEFVMLDPWVRVPLSQVNGSSIYSAQFYAPGKEGIYQFKIVYKKPGYTFLTESERVTLRPYKHDEYERFLFVASPYFFGLFATVAGTFIFVLAYLYSIFRLNKKNKTQ